MALLISPNRPDSPVYAHDPKAGFIQDEITRHLDGNGIGFRLQKGGVLLVDSLLCSARAEEINVTATCLLRNAVSAPGADVCGNALLLGSDEFDLLSEHLLAAFFIEGTEQIQTALLLDRDDGVRPTIALGLESHRYRVIQARTATDAVGFCQKHLVDVLIADVGSLEPHALEGLKYTRQAQPQAGVLLISGYDRVLVQQWYPGLLDGLQFLQKPFSIAVLGMSLHLVRKSPKPQPDIEAMTCD